MKIAVIDCGTNTFNLLIVEVLKGGTFQQVYHTRIPVKLGEKSINKHLISPAAMERGLAAISEFAALIVKYGAERTHAYATSAIREAANGEDFIRDARLQSGIAITVINGDKEASLIYKGIREAVKMGSGLSLIMDIGGGSTEFIIANRTRIAWKQSFAIGAARLLDKFEPSDPITGGQVEAIMSYLDAELLPLREAINRYRPSELIGSSGAFESILEMWYARQGKEGLEPGLTEFAMDRESYQYISNMVRYSTLRERSGMKGLIAMRVDMIVIFCLKVDYMLQRYGFNGFRVSTYSLKEGAAADLIQTKYKDI